MNRLIAITLVLWFAYPTVSAAQPLQPLPAGLSASLASTPSLEFGAQLGSWTLDANDELIGGRFGKRIADSLVAEISYDKSRASSWRNHQMIIANLRIQEPNAVGVRRYLTAGVAAAKGLSYSWSPMVGMGLQMEIAQGAVAFRGELQLFPPRREPGGGDGGRFLVGFSVGVP